MDEARLLFQILQNEVYRAHGPIIKDMAELVFQSNLILAEDSHSTLVFFSKVVSYPPLPH